MYESIYTIYFLFIHILVFYCCTHVSYLLRILVSCVSIPASHQIDDAAKKYIGKTLITNIKLLIIGYKIKVTADKVKLPGGVIAISSYQLADQDNSVKLLGILIFSFTSAS